MPRLTEQEQQEIIRFLEADKPLPDRYRFLLWTDGNAWEGLSSNLQSLVYFGVRQMRTEYLQV